MEYAKLIPVSEWVGQGSLISTNFGVMVVHKVNRKNYRAYDEAGQCWDIPIRNQKPLPADTAFDSTAYRKALDDAAERERKALEESLKSPLTLGSVVVFNEARDLARWPGKHVVVAFPSAKGRVRVVKLGGDNGRWVSAHVSSLTEVSV